ncbi:MAG: S1 RNA-binding domain-containing protein [Oscillospiraceae bacterium]
MKKYFPEGKLISTKENRQFLRTEQSMTEAFSKGIILEATAIICDNDHNLIVDLPCGKGIIPRLEGAIGIADGSTRDIALLSRVNKAVCFKIIGIAHDPDGTPIFTLSRRLAQEECHAGYISLLRIGEVIPAKVTHLEPFGCFVDIGCGIPSLIPIDAISVSRIAHPNDRFYNGQDIFVVIKSKEKDRIFLSHKELLGTWQQNASMFNAGETVGGIVRSVESYGIFIELTPNLAGLAEVKENVYPGQSASVYIKAIIPDKMKVKLIIVDVFEHTPTTGKINYFITQGQMDHWIYSTENSEKVIETIF